MPWVIWAISLFLGILTLGSMAFYLAEAIATITFFRSPLAIPNAPTPRLSILVPVCGLEPEAWRKWSSLCEQDYPDYEVLFGVMDPNDPAVPLLKTLAATYHQRVRLLVDLPPQGPNHKDSNVGYLLAQASSDLFVFSDSDIRVRPDYLRIVTAPLHQGFSMVTCAYIARRPKFIGSALASLNRCCDFVPSILIARALDGGVKLGIGVTMVMTRSVLEAAGGIVYNRIGSDYNLGLRVVRSGGKIALSRYILESDTGNEPIRRVYERELRWARTIRFNRGAIYYSQIVCFGTVYSLVLLALTGFAPWAVALALGTWGLRYGQGAIAAQSMGATGLLRWFWLLPLRDGLSFVIWVIGGFGRRIVWRDRSLRVEGDGIISEV